MCPAGVCNLYSNARGQAEIRAIAGAVVDLTGNLPPRHGIFPDQSAPIVRNGPAGRELALARWGMPSPAGALRGGRIDSGVTNVRNTDSPHWRPWLGPEHRCLVPFSSFSEFSRDAGGEVWFAFSEERPLAFFAGIHARGWRSVRKLKEGEVTADLFAFLTTAPNAEIGAVHPRAMPVILCTSAELEIWMTAPWERAGALQTPLADGALRIVARGTKTDPAA